MTNKYLEKIAGILPNFKQFGGLKKTIGVAKESKTSIRNEAEQAFSELSPKGYPGRDRNAHIELRERSRLKEKAEAQKELYHGGMLATGVTGVATTTIAANKKKTK